MGVLWNISDAKEHEADGKEGSIKNIGISLPASDSEYSFYTRTVDEETCNPLKVWHDLGEPSSLKEEQKKLLLEASTPYLKTDRIKAEDNRLYIELCLKKNAVVYFEVNAGKIISDRGYDYDKVSW